MKRFKIGSYVHTGYCRAQIIRESELKGYSYVIRLEPTFCDPYGSKRLWGNSYHVSCKASDEFKELEDSRENNG